MRADGRFAKSLRGVINLGVPPAMSPETAKYIQMSNLGSLMMAGVNVPYMVLCALNGWVMVFVTVAMGRGTLLPLLIFFTAGGVVTLMRRDRTGLMIVGLAAILATFLAALALERSVGPLYRLSLAQNDALRLLVQYTIFAMIVVNAFIGRFGAIAAEDRLREETKRSESLLEQVQEQDRQKT